MVKTFNCCELCGERFFVDYVAGSAKVCEKCEHDDNWRKARAIKNLKEFQELRKHLDQMTDDYAHRIECSELDVLVEAVVILQNFEKELEKDVDKYNSKY